MLLAGVVWVIAYSSAGESILVPKSSAAFPSWESGPLSLVLGHPSLTAAQLTDRYSEVMVAMLVAYALTLLASRSLPLRLIVAVVVAVNLLLLLGPPLQLTDLFNYIGYARLGALHGLNPYTHVADNEIFDPVYRFTGWRDLPSPYGPLFTALSYPLAFLPLPVAYWVLKIATVAASLGFVWCVYRCALLVRVDPRSALVLVAVNPIYVFYTVGAFHNDFFMLLPATAAIMLLLSSRDRRAGGALVVAIAIKSTAVLLLPFLILGARSRRRALNVLVGVVLAAIPIAVLSVALFGVALPNLSEQSSVVTPYSIPNLIGLAVGLGGRTPGLARVIDVVAALFVLWQLRRRNWLAAAGWATIALIASSSWLMPWYVVWVLPLAALAREAWLRRATLVLTAFLLITFVPAFSAELASVNFYPMMTPVGRAANAYQEQLQR